MRAPVTFALVAFFCSAADGATPAAADGYVVIVHPSNTHESLSRSFVEQAFLKKTTRWPNGRRIAPVDLPISSEVRARFSRDLVKRPPMAVKNYWQQKLFSGQDVPPPELESSERVVAYVLRNEGAIGYVSSDTPLGRAKVLSVK